MEMFIKAKGVRTIIFCCYVIISGFLISSCGGGGGGAAPASSTGTAFWAVDFTTPSPTYYQAHADKAAEGIHCYIYVEQGLTVGAAEIAAVRDEFDNNIYPTVRNTFGSEPNPGADNDPKIYILLMNIRDGFNGGSYVAGYFNSGNEYSVADNPQSNVKEMFYMNINPALPLTFTGFFTTLAHEFQHMIHWEQKVHVKGLPEDDTWLNEAMSEIAPTYLYGPNYGRVVDYENAASDSLTEWQGLVSDYGIAYMWAQYFKDQFDTGGGNIFKGIMQQNLTGIASVNSALTTTFAGQTFDTTFKNMSIAIFSGNAINWGVPEWSYTSIDTRPGTHLYGISNAESATLPGLFPIANTSNRNVSALPALPIYSVGFYMYEPIVPPNGSVKWTPSGTETASFIDDSPLMLLYSIMDSGVTYSYNTTGFLVVSNTSGTAQGSVVRTAPSFPGSSARLTPKQMLSAANLHASEHGKSQDICVHSYFTEQEKDLRLKGMRPGF